MITENEVKDLSILQGIPVPQIEKYYVMGWLLWGVYRNHVGRNLVLKGGNCLRKIYFPETRFSDDLDFTAKRFGSAAEFQNQLGSICKEVEAVSGIRFVHDQTRVELKETPHESLKALDGRVYFKGFAGDSNVTFRVKFDVSEFERIVLPEQQHPILHPYSDANLCQTKVTAYSLEEVLAEKLRSWIQRTHSRDLFDVVKIITSDKITVSKLNVLRTFFTKTIFKNIPTVAKEELLTDTKFQNVETHWNGSIICAANAMILATNAITLFKQFIDALFDPMLLRQLGASTGQVSSYVTRRIPASIREPIIEAGKARKLIMMRYDGKDRDIEPYSIKYAVRKSDNRGFEYFHGWDRTRGNHMKKFFLHEIQAVSIINQIFAPHYPVEF